jgi:hypothetical protein
MILLDANRGLGSKKERKGWGVPQDISRDVLISMATAPKMMYAQLPRFISPYAEELTIWLPRLDLSIQEIVQRVHKSIKKRTGNAQLPVLFGSFEESVSFWKGARVVQDLDINIERIAVHPFTMGCTAIHERICEEDERPAHKVSLPRDFWMMTSEVTQEFYERVLYMNPSRFVGKNRPVEHVSWRDAVRFANRLSALEGRERCYELIHSTVIWENPHCSGWRLPTEEEWEYAARAREPYLFSGGDFLREVAWFASNSKRETQPVCTKKRNAFGLCDMSGNVLEWVFDAYAPYMSEDEVFSSTRVLRGGSWYYTANAFRVSKRFYLSEKSRCDDCGFRLVRY